MNRRHILQQAYVVSPLPWPGAIAAASAALLVLSAAASARVSDTAGEEGGAGKAPAVARVEIEGSVTLTPESLRLELATRSGRPYDPAVLDNDLHRLMRTGRYRTVRWGRPRRGPGGVVLTLTVEERPILKKIEYVSIPRADLESLEERAERDEWTRLGIERKLEEVLEDGRGGSGRARYRARLPVRRTNAPGRAPAKKDRDNESGKKREGGSPEDFRLALIRYFYNVFVADKPKAVSLETLKSEARKAGLFAGRRERYDEAVAFRLARRIEGLYREKSLFRARVDYFTEPLEEKTAQGLSQVMLVFAIDEGRKVPIRGCRFIGNRVYSDRKLWGILRKLLGRSGVGKGFDRLRFERVLRFIQQELYRNRGYLDAEVELRYVELFTFDPPEAETRQWLVPRVEIDEGELYTVGEIRLRVAPPEGPEGTAEPLDVAPEDMMSAVTDPADEHRNEPPLKEGGVFSERSVALAARRIRSLLGHHGRINSTVRDKLVLPEKGTTIDVEFAVRPSRAFRVGQVSVRGNYKTKPGVFRRELWFAGVKHTRMEKGAVVPGDVIDSRKLKLAERNIKFTGLVKDEFDENTSERLRQAVHIRTFPRGDGMADLAIDVNEGETGMLQMGVTMSSNNELAGMVEFSQRNFNILGWPRSANNWTNAFTGAGQTLRASASFGTSSKYLDVRFEEPYFLGWPVKLGVGYFDRERTYSEYEDGREGVRVSLSRSWSLHPYKRRRLALSARLTDERVHILIRGIASPEYLAEAGTAHLRRGGLGISFDSRDSWIVPSQGWYAKLSHDEVGGPFGGDKEFTTDEFDLQFHWRLGATITDQPYVLQFRFRASQADPKGDEEIPFYERYYAGGWGTVRGFDYRSVGPKDPPLWGRALGGNFRVLETVEYTFPLSPDGTLRGAFFYDAGNVWLNRSDFDFGDLKQSAGAGLLIQPPGWPFPISIYMGWILNEEPEDDSERVSFMFGTMFF